MGDAVMRELEELMRELEELMRELEKLALNFLFAPSGHGQRPAHKSSRSPIPIHFTFARTFI
jgi:hypothetical protein